MKKFKGILALLLAFIIVASIPFSAFAAGSKADSAAVQEEKKGSDIVATMYLMVSNANPAKPHVWIYMENETKETFTVGHYKLKGNEALSMGAFKDRGEGNGIHYNLERYWVKDATYGRTFSLKTTVTRNEMERISNCVNRHNYWNWIFNCNWFATCVWNIASPKKILYLIAPHITRVEMILWGARRPDFKISKLYNEDKVYKHTDDGLKIVSWRVLPTNTGV